MKISLTDENGQTLIFKEVQAVFTSIIEEDVLCVKIKNENKARRFNLSSLNYWEIVND